ncbi:MAG: polyhydroxyalkanoate depolymerase [Alphaproteobacteria bacterium]|nr:polyhydroxyalkanoate depolymerase [Alphaproteobacteria bacterium]
MLYSLVEMNRVAMAPMRLAAKAGRAALLSPLNPLGKTEYGKSLAAFADVFESSTRYYGKPEWRIDTVRVNSASIPVTPTVAWRSPWCTLLHFKKDPDQLAAVRKPGSPPLPRMLIVAPLSGHYASLLRGTVEAFLPHHDVYITDWSDARMAPVWQGRFDLDDYIDHIRKMLTQIGGGAHVLGVCQPGPPVLAALSMMAEDDDPARPASMTFMGSPIDARRSPTVPNELAEERSFAWFEENMIHTVPGPYPGVMRRVYPGFVQLASFMNMNWGRHVDAQWKFFNHLVEGDGDGSDKHREFYDEYLSVLDLTEEFYLQTIQRVFQEHHLARGIYKYRGTRLVKPQAIRDIALMTVEGELDDISGIGQTQAAHDLCTNIPEAIKADYVQPGVGHYGVFNGARFRTEIVPRVTQFTRRFIDVEAEAAAQDAATSA